MSEASSARELQETLGDDIVLPFRTVRSGVNGRLIRLGPAVDTILTRHNVPDPVAQTLGEAVALTALLGTALKFDGKLILQTKTDGIVDFLVVNFEAPGRVRGYVRYDKTRFAESAAAGVIDQAALLGSGHLAITIDPGEEMERYQGIVALSGESLGDAALTYFRQSEQLPTFLRLAVARHYQAGEDGAAGEWHWRAGGLMVQSLAVAGGTAAAAAEADDDWERTRLLAATVEDHELLDPMLQPERLLYRLFHEEGVRALPRSQIETYCSCSRARVAAFLKNFGADQLADMREPDGGISVTCEFCTATYRFSADELG